jgi:hypothetical protein
MANPYGLYFLHHKRFATMTSTTRLQDSPADNPALALQQRLLQSLQEPGLYAHAVGEIHVLETHISWVILTGDYAYKLKKSVNFGFLDFSTLEKRHFYCNEELRLNRRFAPDLYLDVVNITGSIEQLSLNGSGEVLEYAVRMRQFPQAGLLSRIAAEGKLSEAHVDEIAELVTQMHARAGNLPAGGEYGSPDSIHHWVMENFDHIRPSLTESRHRKQLASLEHWCEQQFTTRKSLLEARREAGYVRECHGDLHLGNLAQVDGRITPFDCIEFNPGLRWIDVMSEAAFLMMDVEDRGYPVLAYRFLNGYLQATGDYRGSGVLPYYLVYRALVRAKVAILRLGQADLDAHGQAAVWEDYESYMALAGSYIALRKRAVIITHGVSGSGKSWWAAQLAERLGAIQIRSDVERKRLYGHTSDAATGSGISSGIYSAEAGLRTYQQLARLAEEVIDAGYPVIVDAAFLRRAERDRFRHLADGLGVPFLVLHFEADIDLLQSRIRERRRSGNDPSEAGNQVLEYQLRSQEPLQPDERAGLVEIDASREPSIVDLTGWISGILS